MAVHFLEDKLKPHLAMMATTSDMAYYYDTIKLFTILKTGSELDKALVLTYIEPVDNTKLKHRCFLLIWNMLDTKLGREVSVLKDSLIYATPGGIQGLDDIVAMGVVCPKICHAVLFAADLLVDKSSPLLNESMAVRGRIWAQVKFADSSRLPFECPMNNPYNFQFGSEFWLMNRYYDNDIDKLMAYVEKYTNHYEQVLGLGPSILTDDQYFKPKYREAMKKMTLHEACFYICIEYMISYGIFTDIERNHLIPTSFTISSTLGLDDDGLNVVERIMKNLPAFFWTKDSQYTWCTRLCLRCYSPRSGKALYPWLLHKKENPLEKEDSRADGLAPGDIFYNFTLGHNTESYISLEEELQALAMGEPPVVAPEQLVPLPMELDHQPPPQPPPPPFDPCSVSLYDDYF